MNFLRPLSPLSALLLLLILHYTQSTIFYRTLLSGEKFKGFILVSPLGDDQYLVSFTVKQSEGDVKWAIHMSSAPYDMAVVTENCKQVKKSPHILRNLSLEERTLSGSEIIGNTVVLNNENGVLACATLILPGVPLLRASFHAAPLKGHIHIIPFQNKARILPDLKYDSELEDQDPKKGILVWKFVDECDEKIATTETANENELGIDSRASFTIEIGQNFTFRMFALFLNGEVLACSPIYNVEIRQLKRGRHLLSQAHFFEPVRSASEYTTGNLHIRDDCLDISTEIIHKSFEDFYPTMNIFGPDSIVLKSLVVDDSCGPLRPQFPRPAATAYYMYPISGRLVLVDMDDQILLTGELRQLLDSSAIRATVQVSSEWAGLDGCPKCLAAESCHTVEGAAVIVGKDEPTVTLKSVFSWFQLATKRSITVDLQWTKVCANITQLTTGALSAHALIKHISPHSASVVASIVVLEYPANNYTEALVNKHQVFSGATAHSRPLDQSITDSTPCSEANLGPSEERWWIDRLRTILASEEHDTTVIIGAKQLVTGVDSVLGTSVLLLDGDDVSCGHFEPLTEKMIVVAKFYDLVRGFVKMTQFGTSNWATGVPTEIYYSLNSVNLNTTNNAQLEIEWEFVKEKEVVCSDAPVFNPFKMNTSSCSPEMRQFCPIGDVSRKSGRLALNSRHHLVVSDLPLSGPYSILNTSLRLRISGNRNSTECAALRRFSEASFHWIAPSHFSLPSLQNMVLEKLKVDPFQVQFDYTRESYKSSCSIYRITVLEEEWRLSEILDMFDVEKKKFKSDKDFHCVDDLSNSTTYYSRSTTASLPWFFITVWVALLIS